ncbi:MAG: dienelactone hydrolase family protein [Actinomycetota bacterium]|nr:dienelactone hydrolase family protein [Actinomycetota bacterium]MDQ3575211.1 dienelactone hydrolase family protein [Actinomycetota bacterium]
MQIPVAGADLGADVVVPDGAAGVVVFAHGSGSGRHSPRNRQVAAALQDAGFATVLADLLTVEEEQLDVRTRHLRFDVDLLASRLVAIADWLRAESPASDLATAAAVGLFGASTGAAAALKAAAQEPSAYRAVVSRGGRPDLAGAALPAVRAPTLLIVGALDTTVLELNEEAFEQLVCTKQLEVVPGASHLFEEPGALEEVARLAREWFRRHLVPGAATVSKD